MPHSCYAMLHRRFGSPYILIWDKNWANFQWIPTEYTWKYHSKYTTSSGTRNKHIKCEFIQTGLPSITEAPVEASRKRTQGSAVSPPHLLGLRHKPIHSHKYWLVPAQPFCFLFLPQPIPAPSAVNTASPFQKPPAWNSLRAFCFFSWWRRVNLEVLVPGRQTFIPFSSYNVLTSAHTQHLGLAASSYLRTWTHTVPFLKHSSCWVTESLHSTMMSCLNSILNEIVTIPAFPDLEWGRCPNTLPP